MCTESTVQQVALLHIKRLIQLGLKLPEGAAPGALVSALVLIDTHFDLSAVESMVRSEEE